ncbi:chemotaxis protein CheB [Cognatilysobacter bugurensis]|uniref:CheB-type methylesterase domain-containing protein n=1 Tax=Cognatilysobacter bugurensis TaxID=543356 RepID=A0A918WB64_9GAMM|nr:chemotaxis protein CheB [Lysobacter bugurensis]GHA88783.1 hypothetical protein GCM10007067_28330 [Lysobacter bugurensis]
MPESGCRVVLLARPGTARDRVRAALSEAGAELALEADPTQADVDEVASARAQVVMVVLDSATEAALERFDAVLLDPAIDVMYEEADLAASRSGWDAARWTRHLAAKLHGHGNVLPPGHSQPDAGPSLPAVAAAKPAVPAAAASAPPGDFDPAPSAEATSAGAGEHALSLESIELPSGEGGGSVSVDMSQFGGFAPLLDTAPPHPLSDEFSPGVEPGEFAGFDPVSAEMTEYEFNADQVITFDSSLREDFGQSEPFAAPVSSGFDLAFESDLMLPGVEAPAASAEVSQFHEFSLDDLRTEPTLPSVELPEPTFDVLSAEPVDPGAVTGSPFAGLSDGHVLALVTDDAPAVAAAPQSAAVNLADLEQRIASLSLVDDVPPTQLSMSPDAELSGPGAVLLVAGLGGPDAVRQVLGALPEGFPRPVLVQQRLDGGRYDRLVTQLQRATALPVDLADMDAGARPGVVYVLPDGIGLQAGPDGLRFVAADPLDALPPADSAVLLLSGADAALATRLADRRWSSAFVAGQSAEGCYDATASNALAERGRPTATPAELARQLVERWSA